ncbi:MAG: YaaL family protein [Clostridiales bacterium]|nr:YaaL family protein [Clostridiales bacterium]
MTDVLHWFRRPRETEEERERAALTTQLHETRCAIQRTYLQFNSTGDPDLIDAAVFDLKAEQARYSYLLRRLKSMDRPDPALKAE